MLFESLPIELRLKKRWCFTGSINEQDPSLQKAPHVLHNGLMRKVDSTADHALLMDWETISGLREQYPLRGIGFILTEGDNLTCIDLDYKDNTAINITERNANIVKTLNTYTEVSQSGCGLHLWLLGEVKGAIKTPDFEVYSKERFIICTGQAYVDRPLLNDPEFIASLNEQVDERAYTFDIQDEPQTKTDEEIISEVYNSDHTGKFTALMVGQWDTYVSILQEQGNFMPFDPSQADAAFMTIVTYYTRNFEQCKRIWRSSALADVTRRYPNDPATQQKKARNLGTEYKLNRAITLARERNAIDEAARQQAIAQAQENVGKLIENAQSKKEEHCPKANAPEIEYPPGKLGELSRYFYDKSFKQIKLFAIAEALAVATAMFGRVYNVSNTGLNTYLMLLAPSGTGKSELSRNPEYIFTLLERELKVMGAKKFIMSQRFTHENAMFKEFNERTSFTQCLSEFGKIFKNMMQEKAGPNATVRDQMTDIYSKSGAFDTVGGLRYTNQDNVVSIDHPVAYSFLGESVSEPFFENVTGDLLTDGFMSRFLVLEYDGEIPYDNEGCYVKPEPELLKHIEQACVGVLRALADPNSVQVMPVKFSAEAEVWKRTYNRKCTDKANKHKSDPVHCSLWTRANLKLIKLAAVCAVMDKPWNPEISVEDLEWAESVVNFHNSLIISAVRSGRMASVSNDQGIDSIHEIMREFFTRTDEQLLKTRIKDPEFYKGQFCVPSEYIMRVATRRAMFKASKSPRDMVRGSLREMEEAGMIQKLSQREALEKFKTTATIYRLMQ